MRYRPTGDFTVTNTFSTNNFGEVGLAQGTKPLIQRTEVELPGPRRVQPRPRPTTLARGVVLDDGRRPTSCHLVERRRRAAPADAAACSTAT